MQLNAIQKYSANCCFFGHFALCFKSPFPSHLFLYQHPCKSGDSSSPVYWCVNLSMLTMMLEEPHCHSQPHLDQRTRAPQNMKAPSYSVALFPACACNPFCFSLDTVTPYTTLFSLLSCLMGRVMTKLGHKQNFFTYITVLISPSSQFFRCR